MPARTCGLSMSASTGEFYDELANVKLTELRATALGKELVLEPVCLYHFKKTSHKE